MSQENLKKLRKQILLLFYQKGLDIGKFKIEFSEAFKEKLYELEGTNEKNIIHSIFYLEDSGYLKHSKSGNQFFAEITVKGIDLVESSDEKINQVFNIYNSHIGTLTGDVYIEKYINEILEDHKEQLDSIYQESDAEKKKKTIKELATSIIKKSGEISIDIATNVLIAYLNNKMGLS
jgi:hypothetical protein